MKYTQYILAIALISLAIPSGAMAATADGSTGDAVALGPVSAPAPSPAPAIASGETVAAGAGTTAPTGTSSLIAIETLMKDWAARYRPKDPVKPEGKTVTSSLSPDEWIKEAQKIAAMATATAAGGAGSAVPIDLTADPLQPVPIKGTTITLMLQTLDAHRGLAQSWASETILTITDGVPTFKPIPLNPNASIANLILSLYGIICTAQNNLLVLGDNLARNPRYVLPDLDLKDAFGGEMRSVDTAEKMPLPVAIEGGPREIEVITVNPVKTLISALAETLPVLNPAADVLPNMVALWNTFKEIVTHYRKQILSMMPKAMTATEAMHLLRIEDKAPTVGGSEAIDDRPKTAAGSMMDILVRTFKPHTIMKPAEGHVEAAKAYAVHMGTDADACETVKIGGMDVPVPSVKQYKDLLAALRAKKVIPINLAAGIVDNFLAMVNVLSTVVSRLDQLDAIRAGRSDYVLPGINLEELFQAAGSDGDMEEIVVGDARARVATAGPLKRVIAATVTILPFLNVEASALSNLEALYNATVFAAGTYKGTVAKVSKKTRESNKKRLSNKGIKEQDKECSKPYGVPK